MNAKSARALESVEERLELVNQIEESLRDSRAYLSALNDLTQLQLRTHDADNRVTLAAVMALSRLFTRWSRADLFRVRGELPSALKRARLDETTSNEASAQVSSFLKAQYDAYVEKLLELLEDDNDTLQLAAHKVLMTFVGKISVGHYLVDLHARLLRALLANPNLNSALLSQMKEYLIHSDVRYYMLTVLAEAIERYNIRAYVLLRSVSMPDDASALGEPLVPPSPESVDKKESPLHLSMHRKAFQRAWSAYLRTDLPAKIHSLILESAHNQIIPFLSEPMVLMDWFTECYNRGGEDALRALHGLFILIAQHNLDYPDFYSKLYAQFTPQIFNSTLRSKLLRLSELFLKSPLLPTSLVAAFVKKLLRLALLHASPDAVLASLEWSYNLCVVHPTIHFLVHRSPQSQSLTSSPHEILHLTSTLAMQEDPFNEFANLSEARNVVGRTSLWEVLAMMHHHIPTVAQVAKLFKNKFGKRLYVLKDEAETSFDRMFELENARKVKKGVPLAFEEPKALLRVEYWPGWDFNE